MAKYFLFLLTFFQQGITVFLWQYQWKSLLATCTKPVKATDMSYLLLYLYLREQICSKMTSWTSNLSTCLAGIPWGILWDITDAPATNPSVSVTLARWKLQRASLPVLPSSVTGIYPLEKNSEKSEIESCWGTASVKTSYEKHSSAKMPHILKWLCTGAGDSCPFVRMRQCITFPKVGRLLITFNLLPVSCGSSSDKENCLGLSHTGTRNEVNNDIKK